MALSTTPSKRERGKRNRGEVADAFDQSLEALVGQHIRPAADGCWLYKGMRDRYIRTPKIGWSMPLHRWVYVTMVGPIDEGMHVHHKCQQPACCNPAHLEALTPKEHKAAHRLLDAI